jgi:hypothetical protein
MKKQILIFGTIVISIGLFSCRKENVERPQTNFALESGEQRNTPTPNGEFTIDPLLIGLKGVFEFNGDLKDKTGQLPNGISTVGRVSYVYGRKGTSIKAVQFNGYYGIQLPDVPIQPNMSVAVWVKYTSTPSSLRPFVFSSNEGLGFSQQLNKYHGVVTTPSTSAVISAPIDDKWHHLAATYNGTELRFYVDGKLVGTSANAAQFGPLKTTYKLGYFITATGTIFWKGCMDDLYIYNRTLSAADVQKLYSL